MFFVMFYRFFHGYVSFSAKGAFPERFLNLCAANGITIWSPKIKNNTLFGKMLAKDYKNIRHFAHISGILPRIYKKQGLKCFVMRYRGRYGIVAGALIFAVMINLLSMFTWNISIEGNQKISDEKIMSALEKVGVYEGVLRRSIDTENARQQLLINEPSLSWCAINLDGCFASVVVRETNEKKTEQKTSYPANIVAKQSGIIKSIRAYYGSPSVKVGEAVAKGDLLVSGTMEDKTGSIVYCEARAQILAQTIHTLKVYVPFKQQRSIVVSQPQTRSILELFGAKIPFYFGEIEQPYSVKRSVFVPTFNEKRLPLKLYSAEFSKTETEDYTIDENKAKSIAETELLTKCEKELKNIAKSKLETKFSVDKNGVYAAADYVCEEDIATPKKILIN